MHVSVINDRNIPIRKDQTRDSKHLFHIKRVVVPAWTPLSNHDLRGKLASGMRVSYAVQNSIHVESQFILVSYTMKRENILTARLEWHL